MSWLLLVILSGFLLTSCEGEAGAPGVNRLGADLHAPIVELTLPASSRTYYNHICFEAIVADDGELDSVRFLIDGQIEIQPDLLTTSFPWQIWIDELNINPGRHFVQALAWDKYGHQGASSWVTVNIGAPDQEPDEEDVSFYDPLSEGDVKWRIPDELGEYTGIGSRVTLNRPALVRRAHVKLYRDDMWWGASWQFEIRSSKNGLPDSLIHSFDLDGHLLWRGDPPVDNTYWKRLATGGSFEVPREFFILATMAEDQGEAGDTLALMSDGGYLRNWHGVIQRQGQWENFSYGPTIAYNPLIRLEVSY